jgi:DNA adenine methylase
MPLVRWVGGKRALAAKLVGEICATQPRVYVEPFLGGGAIALAMPAQTPKLLVDVNPQVIDLWLCVQRIPGSLVAELRAIEKQFGDGYAGYMAARSEFNSMIKNVRPMWARRSALFLYLNARCFNGLWRTNAKGLFNVPYGKLAFPKRLDIEDIIECRRVIENATITCDHFAKAMGAFASKRTRAGRGTIEELRTALGGVAIYADPPYDGTFDGYAKDGFTEDDQRLLASQLEGWAAVGASVWASNADTPLVREIYAWAQIESEDEHHSVGSKPERRGKRGCVLIRGGGAIK